MRILPQLGIVTTALIFIGGLSVTAQETIKQKPWVQQKHFERMCAKDAVENDNLKMQDNSKIPERLGKYLLLSDAQMASFKEVHETFQKSMTDAKALCTVKMDFQSVPGRMAYDEAMMDARLKGVRNVRVKMDAFYSTLNNEQKAKFNAGYNRNQSGWRHPYDED